MSMLSDMVIDLETLDTTPNAVVLSLGAVLFDPFARDNHDTLDDPDRTFYEVLKTQNQLSRRRTISSETLEWWMQQSTLAQNAIFHPDVNKRDVTDVLSDFIEFSTRAKNLWGNGSSFDNVIFKSLFQSFSLLDAWPFPYNGDNDLRTLKRIAHWIPSVEQPIHHGLRHHALEDAKYEVLKIQQYTQRIIHGQPKQNRIFDRSEY